MSDPPRFFFVHLQKTAGTALFQRLRDHFGTIPSLRSTRTTIVLSTAKETAQLPLDSGPEESPHV